jgi:hypothetical protein
LANSDALSDRDWLDVADLTNDFKLHERLSADIWNSTNPNNIYAIEFLHTTGARNRPAVGANRR